MGINASKESQVKVKMKVKKLHRLVFSSFVQALQEGQGPGMPSCQKPSGRELFCLVCFVLKKYIVVIVLQDFDQPALSVVLSVKRARKRNRQTYVANVDADIHESSVIRVHKVKQALEVRVR